MKRWPLGLLVVLAGCGAGFDATGPIALDDTASTTSNMEIEVDVLANDRPSAGEALALGAVELVDGPGAIEIGGQGVRYLPEPGSEGLVEIRYTAVTSGGVATEGTLRIVVTTPRLAFEFPDGSDFGLVYLGGTGEIRVNATATGGDVPMLIETGGIAATIRAGCDVVPQDETCQILLTWAPDGVGELTARLAVNDFETELTGVAEHAIVLEPNIVSGSVPEGDVAELSAELVNRAPFALSVTHIEPSNPRVTRRGTCGNSLEANASCRYLISVDASTTPAGSGIIDEAAVAYGRAGHLVAVPIEVKVTPPNLAAPVGVSPVSGHGVWAQLLFEGIDVTWSGDGGPGGVTLEAEVCTATGDGEACIDVGEDITDSSGAGVILVSNREEFLERFAALATPILVKSRVPVATLRWRVSATSLGGTEAPSAWMTYPLKSAPVDIIEISLFPEPATEFTPAIYPGSEFPELIVDVMYELNVFEPVELRLHPIAEIGGVAQSEYLARHAVLEEEQGKVTVTVTREGCTYLINSIELVINRFTTSDDVALTHLIYSQTTQFYWLGYSCIG